jgi:cyclophilin family peptidyl-prolyl cis-trans isomerase
MGDICVELDYSKTPKTVANFIGLIEGAQSWIDPETGVISTNGYYNGSFVYQVTNGLVLCGSRTGDGTDGPGYVVQDELDTDLEHDQKGLVSMFPSASWDSNGAQFSITTSSASELDDINTAFGLVVEGLDILDDIAEVALNTNQQPVDDILITNAFITINGTDAQSFSITNQGLPVVEAIPVSISTANGLSLSVDTESTSIQTLRTVAELTEPVVWSELDCHYSSTSNEWVVAISNATDRGFFRAHRIEYTIDNEIPTNITDHIVSLTVTDDDGYESHIYLKPEDDNGGTARYGSNDPDNITFWSYEVDLDNPYNRILYVETDYPDSYLVTLNYKSEDAGRCTLEYEDKADGEEEYSFNGTGTFDGTDYDGGIVQ